MTYRTLSLGGGVQSTTLALMSAAGDLPLLDAAIMADTHRETQETYDHVEWLTGELEKANIPLIVCSAGDLGADHLNAVDRVSQAPFYVRNGDQVGKIMRRCSRDYKVRPVRRAARDLMLAAGETTLEQWVGISWDEIERMNDAGAAKYITTVWPLIDLRMTRDDCIAWLADHGYERPPRSACYMCPQASQTRWKTMRDHHPAEWEKAIAFDHAIRAHGIPGIDGTIYTVKAGIPLDELDLDIPDDQLTLFDDPDCEGGCYL